MLQAKNFASGAAWVSLAVLAAACWWMTAAMAVEFSNSSGGGWESASLGALFVMWAVMMAAMMTPSFVPAAVLFSRLAKNQRAAENGRAMFVAPGAPLALAAGYLSIWLGFSAAAAVLQQTAGQAAALHESLYLKSDAARGLLLCAAGGFQFTALKFSCLTQCRHPALFFMLHWRDGAGGAAYLGARFGLVCLGCCWLLMLLLFVGGVMEWRWIAALTLYALAEKVLPLPPKLLARATGFLLLAAGLSLFV